MRKRMNRTAPVLDREELPRFDGTWPLAEPFCIGSVMLENRVVQPPLAGIANWAFREQSRRFGVGLAVSEMISAFGVRHNNERTQSMLTTEYDGGPVAMQFFGPDPEVMADAARAAADEGADIIDINMGCPVRKVTKTGAGAALLTDPAEGAAVVAAVVAAVSIPVTVKMRRGMTPATADPVGAARIFEDAGADAIIFHPRTASEEYEGRADHTHTAAVVDAVNIPVIASGDIDSPAEAARILSEVGATAVAIGRPALGNPWLYEDVLGAQATRIRPLDVIAEEVLRFADDVRAVLGDNRACAYMRKFYPWYLAGHDVPAEERAQLLVEPTLDAALERFARLAHDR